MNKVIKITEEFKKEISEMFRRLNTIRAEEEAFDYIAINVFKPKDK